MFSAFQTFGKLGALASSVARAWSPLALWPDGIASPGMWISPRTLTSEWQDSAGTTPVVEPGTVADASNPVGLALDIRAGATVLTDPGNHMLQSTSAARPLLSARRNLLQYTEDFTNGYWVNATATVTPNYGTAPDGTQTSTRLVFPGANNAILKSGLLASLQNSTTSVWMKGSVGETIIFENNFSTATTITLTGAWQLATRSYSGDAFVISTYAPATARDIEVWHPQFELGLDATDYQSVPGDGSTYATAFPIYQKYDGVDDGMATAAFTAGTLIDGMDCMIPVRRDSAAATYLISDTASRGFFEWESGDTNRPDVSAGTPTYYVDGVACTATRGALFTALTAGDWHILEARGLDLSTWTKVEVSSLVSYRLNGARGDILLFPSTASTEDKDAARQYLADYYGVTLP